MFRYGVNIGRTARYIIYYITLDQIVLIPVCKLMIT